MRTEQPTKCFVPLQKLKARLVPRLADRSNVVVLLWFSVAWFWCQSFGDVSTYFLPSIYLFFILFLVRFGLLSDHLLGNSCSLG